MSREEVERRVREDREGYSHKFSGDARLFCSQVSGHLLERVIHLYTCTCIITDDLYVNMNCAGHLHCSFV